MAQTLFVVAAAVQTLDILWRWFQALRAKHAGKQLNVVIATPDGEQVHWEKVTLEELKRIFD